MTSTASPGAGSSGPQLPDEDKLDSPSRQTLWMLGVVCTSTLIMWAAGRLACNYQVPGESLRPRPLTFEDRSRTAKDAALEFSVAVESGDFATATQLSDAQAKTKLAELEKSCGDCAARKAKKDGILVVGTVLADNGKEAYVSAAVEGGARGPQKWLLHAQRGPKFFQIVEILEPSAKIPALAAPEPPPQFHMGPASKVPPFLRRPPEVTPASGPPGVPSSSSSHPSAPSGVATPPVPASTTPSKSATP